MQKRLTYITLIILLLLGNTAWAQRVLQAKRKATLIFEMLKHVEWADEEDLTELKVGLLCLDNQFITDFRKITDAGYPDGTSVRVVLFRSPAEITPTHVLFVSQNYISEIEKVWTKIGKNATLIITDQVDKRKYSMINFLTPDPAGNVTFEVNKMGVYNQNIYYSQRILGLGGIEISPEDLFKESEEELKDEKQNAKQLEDEIKKQMQELKVQKDSVARLQNDIKTKQREILDQQSRIEDQRYELADLQDHISIQQREMREKEEVLDKVKEEIDEQQKLMRDQADRVKEQNAILERQSKAIEEQENKIKSQTSDITKQLSTIEQQQLILLAFVVLFILIAIMVFFIIRAYRQNKQKNRKLQEQNHQINRQKQEIESQKELLEFSNRELERLSLVASETENAVAILDAEGNFEWVNSGYTRMYGYTLQLLKQECDENIMGVSANHDIKEIFASCLKEGKTVVFESEMQTRKGQTIWAQSTLTPIVNDAGKVTRLVLIDSDITDIKNAEKEIRQRNEMIVAQSRELESKNVELAKLSIVASNTDNSVVIFDNDGEIEWANDGFTRMLGVTLEDFKSEYGSNIYTSSLNPDIRAVIEEAVAERKSATYTGRTKTKQHDELWIQTTLTPIVDEQGKLTKIIAIDADVTKIKLAEEEIARQKQAITDSILYARRIQNAVLPPDEYMAQNLPDFFVLYKPKDIVSGDFYWMTKLGRKIIITAADCTGHGVPGAFMSMLGVSFLVEVVNRFNEENIHANLILNELRENIKRSLRQTGKRGEAKDGMDMALIMLDLENMELEFAGANNPLLLVRKTDETAVLDVLNKGHEGLELIEIRGDSMPIGIYQKEKESFTNHQITLHKGDCLYIFSDGYVDQIGGDRGRKFMIRQFKDKLLEMNNLSMSQQRDTLDYLHHDWLHNYGQEYEQMDDILVIGITI